MKKALLFLLCILPISSIYAQSHSSRVGINAGVLYENGMDATILMERETRYHNAWEFFANGYLKWSECENCNKITTNSFFRSYNTWGVGIAYKPCITRSRNRYGSLRIGASGGSNTHDFLGGIHLGYEYNYALRHGFKVYWLIKVDMMIPDRKDLFRTGAAIGIKLPTVNRYNH